MKPPTPDSLKNEYLRRLRAASRHLPPAERLELERDIRDHITAALEPGATAQEVQIALDRLGAPESVVADHLARMGLRARHTGRREWVTILLLLLGGFLAALGWVVGAGMLWTSDAWSIRAKFVGTLVVPGGLAAALLGASRLVSGHSPGQAGTGTLAAAAIIALVLAPLCSAAFLARTSRAAMQ